MAVIFRVLLRMDHTNYLLRGWRESLAGDIAMSAEKAQGFSLVLENCRVLAGRAGIPAAKEFWTDPPCQKSAPGHFSHLDFRELLLAR